MFSDLIAC